MEEVKREVWRGGWMDGGGASIPNKSCGRARHLLHNNTSSLLLLIVCRLPPGDKRHPDRGPVPAAVVCSWPGFCHMSLFL